MARIGEVMKPRNEVIDRTFQGALKAHNADAGGNTIESQPKQFFDITYPSNRLKRVIEHINAKASGESSQGAVVLTGPYGSGKSHGLITLYHLFKHPKTAKEWAERWDLKLRIPANSDAVIISTLNEDPRFLWEPVFRKAGGEKLLENVERFASIELVKKLVSGRTLAVILDEMESWYVSMEKTNPDFLERNRSFLQCLLEVASDSGCQLFVFLSTLGRRTTLEEILSRTNPPREDMSTSGDRERIMRHRLFVTPEDKVDGTAIQSTVKQYVEAYRNHLTPTELNTIEGQMIRDYPFHPQLLELLGRLYESPSSQNVRGQMVVLAEALASEYDSTDLLVISDMNERAFRGMNLELVNRYEVDVTKRLQSDSVGRNLLRTVLVYSLSEIGGSASETEVLFGCYKPQMGTTLTDLSLALDGLVGKAVYLHRDKGRWLMRGEENAVALVEREVQTVPDSDSDKVIREITRSDVFGESVYLYETDSDRIPDDRAISYVVLGKSYGGTKQLQEELVRFCKERRWGNNLVFISPLGDGPLQDKVLLEKAKRIVAARSLRTRLPEAIEKIDEIIEAERQQLRKEIERRYGYVVIWVQKQDGNLDIMLKRAPPDIEKTKQLVATDENQLEEWLLEKLGREERGIKVEWLLMTLKSLRGAPKLTDDSVLYGLVARMQKDGSIIVQGERGRYLSRADISEILDEYVLLDPKFLRSAITIVEAGTNEQPKPSTAHDGVDRTTDGVQQGGMQESRTAVTADYDGNSPSAVVGKLDSGLNEETDLIVGAQLSLDDIRLSKDEIIRIVESLPKQASVRLRLEVERDED